MHATATTWSITGQQFLGAYAALCLVAVTALWWRWSGAMGAGPEDDDAAMPDLGVYELAALGGGTQLAITSAATQLHSEGLIKSSLVQEDALEAAGELDPRADPLERAVFEILRSGQPISAEALREQVACSDAVQEMQADLTGAGLLVPEESVMRTAQLIILVGGLLALLGIVGIAAAAIGGGPIAWLVVMVVAVVVATLWLAAHVPLATHRGRAMLKRWRDAHDDLRRNPGGGECALAAALFGGGALWLAAPDVASALGVEREDTWSAGSGGGGGGCGGCGGCGG